MTTYYYSKGVKEECMINTSEGYVYCFKSDGYLGVMSATKIYIPAAFDAIEIVPTKDRYWPFIYPKRAKWREKEFHRYSFYSQG